MLGNDLLRSSTPPSSSFAPRREARNGPVGPSRLRAGPLAGAAFAEHPGRTVRCCLPFAFTVPSPAQFAEAAGRLGIGNTHHVVAYSHKSPRWATRLWWLLRYFGHEVASVLNGRLGRLVASGGTVESGPAHYPGTTSLPTHARAFKRPSMT